MAQLAQIAQIAAQIQRARSVVVLTGAGLSTPSGIPDFRSPQSGLWQHADPLEVASLTTFRYEPERFFSWLHPLATLLQRARPNAAHYALAALERARYVQHVITQNIDGLHTRAGSTAVIELHGTLRTTTCGACHRTYPAAEIFERFVATAHPPRCAHCGGLLKPDAILMGEQLSSHLLQKARQAVRQCELLLVAGSSLEVMPVAGLPLEALNAGAELILFNYDPTYLDARATQVVRGDVAEVLPRLAENLGLNL